MIKTGHISSISPQNFSSVDLSPFLIAAECLGYSLDRVHGFRVVFVDDYVQPEIIAVNEAALQRRSPWMLVKLRGPELWVGPIFRPGQNACWNCMRHRLVENRWAEHAGWLKGIPTCLDRNAISQGLTNLACVYGASQIEAFACGHSALDGAVASFRDDTEGPHLHPVQRLTSCELCSEKGRPSLWPHASRAPLSARLARHYSHISGFVSNLNTVTDDSWAPVHIVVADCVLPLDQNFPLAGSPPECCVGRGFDIRQATFRCLAEGAERYSLFRRGDERVLSATFDELGSAAIDPGDILGFSMTQYAERDRWNQSGSPNIVIPEPFDKSVAINWVAVEGNQTERFIPSSIAYLRHATAEHTFTVTDSTGCAAGETLADARERALFEVIERDAAGIWWFNRCRRPALDWQSFDDPFLSSVPSLFQRHGVDVWLLDLTSDWQVPVYAALCSDGAQIRYAFAGGKTPSATACSAVTELIQTWISCQRHPESCRDCPPQEFLRPCGMTRPREPGEISWSTMCQRAEALGLDVYSLDLTRREVEVPVARVIVPGTLSASPRFGLPRLYEMPVKMGWRNRSSLEEELNRSLLL